MATSSSAEHIMDFYSGLDGRIKRFQQDIHEETGQALSCKTGCGKCCLSAEVESTPYECIPMARALIDSGGSLAEDVLAKLEDTQLEPQCLFYMRQSSDDLGLGRCTMYATRPLICRLFGFAAVRSKQGRQGVTLCTVMKEEMPEMVTATREAVSKGTVISAPVYHLEWSELHAMAAGWQTKVMPINRAFAEALRDQLWQDELRRMKAEEPEEEAS